MADVYETRQDSDATFGPVKDVLEQRAFDAFEKDINEVSEFLT